MESKLNIRRMREERGLTLDRLGKLIGVSGGYLSELERGVKNINSRRIFQLSEALDCEPSDLFRRNEGEDFAAFNKDFSKLNLENKQIIRTLAEALLIAQK